MPTLYDHLGRPVQPQELTREHATTSLTGVRTVWDETVASGLTPQRLAAVLRNAVNGDAHEYLTLAEEMEERDLHYACELGKRKLAVSLLPATVEAYSDKSNDQKLADEIRSLIRRPGFRGLLKDLLDSLGKGYSVCEILWDRSGHTWQPKTFAHRDGRFFQFDRTSQRELRLRDEADLVNGLALAPYKYIIHVPKLKSGLPIRGGLARLAAWAWMLKNYSVKDWMAFAEVFGMPLRIGKYGSGANKDDINILKMAVANLGSDAAAVIPESMLIDLVERKSTGGESLFQVMADWFDAQVSRGILGQTATTQGTPGRLGNEEAQSQVRDDIRDDDALQLAETINRDLIQPYIDLNWGVQKNYPQLILQKIEQEDITAISDSLAKLIPLGLRIEQSVVRDRLGWPDPDPKARPEELLGATVRTDDHPPGPPPPAKGLNREEAPTKVSPDTVDLLTEQTLAMADGSEMVDAVYQLLAESGSLEEAAAKLLDSYDRIPVAKTGQALADRLFQAELTGRAEIIDEGKS